MRCLHGVRDAEVQQQCCKDRNIQTNNNRYKTRQQVLERINIIVIPALGLLRLIRDSLIKQVRVRLGLRQDDGRDPG